MIRNVYRLILMIVLSVTSIISARSQGKKINTAPLPVIATNPTTGVMFGFSPGFTWHLGSQDNTSMSSAVASIIYTTNRQFLLNLRGSSFLPGDRWIVMADLRFQITSQPTYGLGTTRHRPGLIINDDTGYPETYYYTRQQMMEYNAIRAYLTGLRRYDDTRFFYGLGYHLDIIYNIDDHRLDLDATPPQITQHHRYNTLQGFSTKENTVSGVSLNAMYDSRDNIANPYNGRYAFATWRVNPEFMGSTKSSSTLWLEYRDYFNLSAQRPRHLIAWWSYGWFVTTGNVPYMNLPATGWDMFSRSGRAYTSGRFRGEDLLYTELEYRFPIQRTKETFGGVIFSNAATASSRTQDIRLFNHVNVAGGVGLRMMINKRSCSNVTFDYGWATNGAQGFFLSLNEVF